MNEKTLRIIRGQLIITEGAIRDQGCTEEQRRNKINLSFVTLKKMLEDYLDG